MCKVTMIPSLGSLGTRRTGFSLFTLSPSDGVCAGPAELNRTFLGALNNLFQIDWMQIRSDHVHAWHMACNSSLRPDKLGKARFDQNCHLKCDSSLLELGSVTLVCGQGFSEGYSVFQGKYLLNRDALSLGPHRAMSLRRR